MPRDSLARVLFLAGRFEEALAAVADAERLREPPARVNYLRGRIEEERGRFNQALEAYRLALAANRDMVDALAGEASVCTSSADMWSRGVPRKLRCDCSRTMPRRSGLQQRHWRGVRPPPFALRKLSRERPRCALPGRMLLIFVSSTSLQRRNTLISTMTGGSPFSISIMMV